MKPTTDYFRALIVGASVAIACTTSPLAMATPAEEIVTSDIATKMSIDDVEEHERTAEKEKQKQINEEIKRRNKVIKEFDNLNICFLYGYALRKESFDSISTLKTSEDAEKILQEVRRRKLVLDKKATIERTVRIGMSTCQLYASYGSPTKENRTVGAWGEHIQYIYERQYIYNRNGRVSSWQD